MKKKKKAPAARAMANTNLKLEKKFFTVRNTFYEENKSACGVRTGANKKEIQKIQKY